jgi:hypothetical protein
LPNLKNVPRNLKIIIGKRKKLIKEENQRKKPKIRYRKNYKKKRKIKALEPFQIRKRTVVSFIGPAHFASYLLSARCPVVTGALGAK